LAIRAALGANRMAISAQLFAEALILVSAGGALGLLAGPWLLDGFLAVAPLGRLTLPRYLELHIDAVTLGVTIATLAAAGLVAGTVPTLVGRKVSPSDVLNETGRGTFGHQRSHRWASWLVAMETALTIVLLVAAGLFARSYASLESIDLGFERERIVRLAVTLSRSDVADPARLPAMYERLRSVLAAVPGVSRIGLVNPTLPPWDGYRSEIQLVGVALPSHADTIQAGTHLADPGLLPLLGSRVLAGRNIDSADGPTQPPVVVVSEALARHFGGPERAVGRSITFVGAGHGAPSGTHHIVGVAENIGYDGLVAEDTRQFVRADSGADVRASRYDVYVPLAAHPNPVLSIGAYTDGDPSALVEPLRRRLAELAPASPTHWVSTMEEEVALEYEPTRFYTMLVMAFSVSALALTSVGLCAILSHAALRRTGEIGLRMALGSSRTSAAWLILRGGLIPVWCGAAAGAGAAVLVGRTMAGLLFGIEAFDGVSFVAALAAVLLVALGASLLPLRRVTSIDAATALRGS
jgi:predicted permease